MSLAKLVASAVATADSATRTLRVGVSFQTWKGRDEFGGDTYNPAITIPALVDYGAKIIVDEAGREITVTHAIHLLRPLADAGDTGRREPIDPRDRFTLPDGTTGYARQVRSFVNGETESGYYFTVMMGV